MHTKTFTYKNINISFTDTGKGSAVILLHGFLENSTMWDTIVSTLSKKNRIITIDLLGHGKTDNFSYVHTMSDQAEMVKAVLNHLRLRKYVLIGHSLGGYIALAFAELFPENIKKLCLLNSTALPDSKERQLNRDRAIKLVKKNAAIFVGMAIPNLFTEKSRLKFKGEIIFVKKEALKTSTQGIIASLEGMRIRKDRTFVLQNNTFKKLFILGKKDPLLNRNDLLEQVKNTDVEVIEFSNGHMSHIENLTELIVVLREFVK